jgi:chemotaxis protein MotB
MKTTIGSAFLLTLLAGACVPEGKYKDAVASGEAARALCAQAAEAQVRSADAKARADRAEVDALRAALAASEGRLTTADRREKELLAQVDEQSVESRMLRAELQHAGENEALYKSLALRLKGVVDTGDLSIVVRGGRMVLRLPNDVLFDSGSVELKPAGKKALTYVASALSTVTGRSFQVAGHTDTVPIQSARFASNWDLSTARAVEVVRFLVTDGGLKPALLSAAGYGEFDPVAPNITSADRAKNRRIEITLQPSIKELVPVPDRY